MIVTHCNSILYFCTRRLSILLNVSFRRLNYNCDCITLELKSQVILNVDWACY